MIAFAKLLKIPALAASAFTFPTVTELTKCSLLTNISNCYVLIVVNMCKHG